MARRDGVAVLLEKKPKSTPKWGGVVIEVDGNSHDAKSKYDSDRDLYLEGLGLVVIRVMARDVLGNLSGVMDMLRGHFAL